MYPNFSLDISSTALRHRYSLRFPKQEFSNVHVDAIYSVIPLKHLQSLSMNNLTSNFVSRLQDLSELSSIALHGNGPLQEFVMWDDFDPADGFVAFSALEELTLCEIERQVILEMDHLHRALFARHLIGSGLSKLTSIESPGVDAARPKEVSRSLD
ncbi:hypothetical protein BDN72DRAFT_903823 [Pluteus cervinus]|uniref:Uncharacterized protein n=1 Tax=Pluteus cervinus TaxID=181527 RepID=A0ACD3A8W1_9AGAR|nr:hypothetical protein BDN72DRAFT_903823 [Pluteus cervinus]